MLPKREYSVCFLTRHEKCLLNSLRVVFLAACGEFVIPANPGSGPGQAPVSRKPDWIPPYQVRGRLSQARNDGPGEKTIPSCLRWGRSYVRTKENDRYHDVTDTMPAYYTSHNCLDMHKPPHPNPLPQSWGERAEPAPYLIRG